MKLHFDYASISTIILIDAVTLSIISGSSNKKPSVEAET